MTGRWISKGEQSRKDVPVLVGKEISTSPGAKRIFQEAALYFISPIISHTNILSDCCANAYQLFIRPWESATGSAFSLIYYRVFPSSSSFVGSWEPGQVAESSSSSLFYLKVVRPYRTIIRQRRRRRHGKHRSTLRSRVAAPAIPAWPLADAMEQPAGAYKGNKKKKKYQRKDVAPGAENALTCCSHNWCWRLTWAGFAWAFIAYLFSSSSSSCRRRAAHRGHGQFNPLPFHSSRCCCCSCLLPPFFDNSI